MYFARSESEVLIVGVEGEIRVGKMKKSPRAVINDQQ